MRIVFLSVWFSEKMGYIENCLPKSLAALGHDVHVISTTAQVYYNDPDYASVYEPYLGKNIQEVGQKKIDGFTLHRLPFDLFLNKIYFKNLGEKLKELKPDVVQSFEPFSFYTLQGAYYKLKYNYNFFTANHTVASVFSLYTQNKKTFFQRLPFYITRTIPGRLISMVTSRCYPATIDAMEIAVKFYGIPKHKVKLACLGVDTDFFKPQLESEQNTQKRNLERQKLGFSQTDIVCIYTGRFTAGKNPLCLAKAIEILVDQGYPFKALFMGNGPQLDEIKSKRGCIVHDFVPYHELPDYYALADIGVWPRQESTSMLDAAACALPIVISNRVKATERVEGNGLTYLENDEKDLAAVILKLQEQTQRKRLGDFGKQKIEDQYSWTKIAKERIEDYSFFVSK
jgi:glycosyltransferase involved in cell wall biosynthesis